MERFTSYGLMEGINYNDYVIGTYYVAVEKDVDIFRYAESLGIEQTTGTWVEVPEETIDVKKNHGAIILNIHEVPAYESMIPPNIDTRQFVVRLAFPKVNFENNIPLLLTTLLGNISSLGSIKLIDVDFPQTYVDGFRGPKFGIEGIRQILDVYDRPLVLNMIKPCTGYSPEIGAKLFYEAAVGGLDIVKDDELIANPEFCPLEQRVRKYMEQCKRVFEETGKKVLYTPNITDRPDKILDNARRVIDAGANALMLNFVTVGLPAVQILAEESDIDVPILGHSDFAGALTGSPSCGVSSNILLGKLARLMGLDMVLVLNPYGKFPFLRDQYLRIFYNLTASFRNIKPAFTMIGGGVSPAHIPMMIKDLGVDFIIGAGGAMHGHPMGPAAGTKAFFQAIKAVMNNVDLKDAGEQNEELGMALKLWK